MNFEGIVLLSKAARELHETESVAEVQLEIDSCRFISQSNYLNNSYKDYDWPILACFIREQSDTVDATFTRSENKVWFENSANAWRNYLILYHKTNKEASTVLCSVVKHSGSGRALKKWGKTLDYVSCFPPHSFVLYRFLRTLQENRAQSKLLYFLIICNLSPSFVAHQSTRQYSRLLSGVTLPEIHVSHVLIAAIVLKGRI